MLDNLIVFGDKLFKKEDYENAYMQYHKAHMMKDFQGTYKMGKCFLIAFLQSFFNSYNKNPFIVHRDYAENAMKLFQLSYDKLQDEEILLYKFFLQYFLSLEGHSMYKRVQQISEDCHSFYTTHSNLSSNPLHLFFSVIFGGGFLDFLYFLKNDEVDRHIRVAACIARIHELECCIDDATYDIREQEEIIFWLEKAVELYPNFNIDINQAITETEEVTSYAYNYYRPAISTGDIETELEEIEAYLASKGKEYTDLSTAQKEILNTQFNNKMTLIYSERHEDAYRIDKEYENQSYFSEEEDYPCDNDYDDMCFYDDSADESMDVYAYHYDDDYDGGLDKENTLEYGISYLNSDYEDDLDEEEEENDDSHTFGVGVEYDIDVTAKSACCVKSSVKDKKYRKSLDWSLYDISKDEPTDNYNYNFYNTSTFNDISFEEIPEDTLPF